MIDELESPEFTEVLSQKFGKNLHPFPRLTTIRRLSQAKDGRIHTDGPSKVMTLLVYMNDCWQDGGAGDAHQSALDLCSAKVQLTKSTVTQ